MRASRIVQSMFNVSLKARDRSMSRRGRTASIERAVGMSSPHCTIAPVARILLMIISIAGVFPAEIRVKTKRTLGGRPRIGFARAALARPRALRNTSIWSSSSSSSSGGGGISSSSSESESFTQPNFARSNRIRFSETVDTRIHSAPSSATISTRAEVLFLAWLPFARLTPFVVLLPAGALCRSQKKYLRKLWIPIELFAAPHSAS